MIDGAGADRGEATSGTNSETGTLGTLARGALATIAVILGIVWIARLAVGGPTLDGGLLFEVLPPIALLYLGLVYLGDQRRVLRDDP